MPSRFPYLCFVGCPSADGRVPAMVWPDVQLIVSKDAATTFALTQKQLASVGSPIITGTSLTPSLPKLLWRWNCAITDGGGDEAATRGKLRGIIDNHRPQEGFVDLDCQQHAAGNGQKKVLSVTDTASRDRWRLEFLYFASTARFSNLVIHRFWTIRKTWLRKFPEDRELVDKVFAVLCQKPLITRWDTTHLAEMYIRALPIDRFREVVAAAFKDELEEQEKAAKAKKARKTTDAAAQATHAHSDNVTDDMRLDSMEATSERQGRYRREAIRIVHDDHYYVLLCIANTTRNGWHHYHCFLQSNVDRKYGSHATHISVLAGGRCSDLLHEMSEPLTTCWWEEHMDRLGRECEYLIVETIVTLCLCSHGDFYRRIYLTFDAFPLKCVLLCPEENPALRFSTGQHDRYVR